jgi:hypothetical protein
MEDAVSKGLVLVGVLMVAIPASMLALPQMLASDGDSVDPYSKEARQRAAEIAKDFLMKAPTFGYDGISPTVRVDSVDVLESLPLQYAVRIVFDSRHSGYGDRTGQVVLQVITPHTTIIRVVEEEVVSAILDGVWDEMDQKPIA